MKSVITYEKRNKNGLVDEMSFEQDNGVLYEFRTCVAIVPGSLDIDIWHAENCMLFKRTSHYPSGGKTVETFTLNAINQPRLFGGDDIDRNVTQEHFTKIVDGQKEPVEILETAADEFYKDRCIEIAFSEKSVAIELHHDSPVDFFSTTGLPIQKTAGLMIHHYIDDIPKTEDGDISFGEITYRQQTYPLFLRHEKFIDVLSNWSTSDIKRAKEAWEKEAE